MKLVISLESDPSVSIELECSVIVFVNGGGCGPMREAPGLRKEIEILKRDLLDREEDLAEAKKELASLRFKASEQQRKRQLEHLGSVIEEQQKTIHTLAKLRNEAVADLEALKLHNDMLSDAVAPFEKKIVEQCRTIQAWKDLWHTVRTQHPYLLAYEIPGD